MTNYILAFDQGTSSSRAIVFDHKGKMISQAQEEFTQYFPNDGWVEHDAEELWQVTLLVCRQAVSQAAINPKEISACGITNQRETTLLWDKTSGEVLHRAIVWQDRRTAQQCQVLKEQGVEELIKQRTGLRLDPYFSATKIKWLLDNVPEARKLAAEDKLAVGTIDSFLIWRLTGGKQHLTDITNASRTSLFNLAECCWDQDLLELFSIPEQILPEILPCDAEFGVIDKEILGAAIPITGVAGDQHAAMIGQACFQPGMVKSTYGTGCFVVMNTGSNIVQSQHRLLSTIAYSVKGETSYALEGSIFNAGTTMKWLRDDLRMIESTAESERLARSIEHSHGVYLVPAFTGLGAPYWQPQARGAILGLTRDTGIPEIVRAGLEAVCYQTHELIQCMQQDSPHPITELRVDGGMAANNWLLQFLADMLQVPVVRPATTETTVLGAALLAGIGAGIYQSLAEVAQLWQQEIQFQPAMEIGVRDNLYNDWHKAVARVLI